MYGQPILHLDNDKIVRATAGAGKTTTLINEVYETYRTHNLVYNKNPRILLTTFTIKAANELSERLIKQAGKIEDRNFLKFCLSAYLEVGTMHSVFSSVLRDLDLEASGSNKFISSSYKTHCAKGFLIDIVKESNFIDYFNDSYMFNEILKYFIKLERRGFKYISVSIKELLESIKSHLIGILDQEDVFSDKIKNEVCSLSSFDELENFSTKIDKNEHKELYKYLTKDFNKKFFIDGFEKYNDILKTIYDLWSKKFGIFVKANKLYTIEDMEHLLIKAINHSTVKSKWDYCFFDEYQDTNPEQKFIIDRLCSDSVKYYVGDPFQSIYFFRGARKKIFDDEYSRIKKETNNIEYKTSSYRSSSKIVNFVNQVSRKLFSDFDELKVTRDEEGRVDIVFFEDESFEKELEYLSNELKELDPKDVLILSKQTRFLSKAYKHLTKDGYSVLPLYGSKLDDFTEAVVLINFLLFLDESSNESSLLTLLFSDCMNISPKQITEFLEEKKEIELIKNEEHSLWDIVLTSKSGNIPKLLEVKNLNLSFSASFRYLINEFGFFDILKDSNTSTLKEFNSFKILKALEDEESKTDFNIKAFCEDLLNGFYPFGKESVEKKSSFKLMTIHGSKGLEAKHVFILGANQAYRDLDNYPLFYDDVSKISAGKLKISESNRLFPEWYQNKISKEKEIKKMESRRLFYVALTRARDSLTLLGSGKKEKKPFEPSWMSHVLKLKELDELNLTQISVPSNQNSDIYCESPLVVNNKNIEKVDIKTFALNMDKLEYTSSESSESSENQNVVDVYASLDKIKKGVEFHSFMERQWAFVDKADFNENDESTSKSNVEKVFLDALEYLKNEPLFPFNEILNTGFREWGYDFFNKSTQKTEAGKIDLWAEVKETVWIVDYKTGALNSKKKGFEQLLRYKNILEDYLPSKTGRDFKLVLTYPVLKKTFIESI